MVENDYIEKYKDKKTGPIAILSFVLALYIFMILNPFITWIIHPFIIYIPIILVTLTYTWLLLENGALIFTKKRLLVFLSVLLFAIYTATPIVRDNLNVVALLTFFVFALIVFFPTVIYQRAFLVFRIIMIFFSVASIILFILLFLKIDLPYYKMPVSTDIMENTNGFYKLYGVVVSSTNSVYDIFGIYIVRMCGPFYEPGHFAIYLGLTLCLEKYLLNRINPFLVIAGFLTFSPAFIFIFVLLMLYDIVFNKRIKPIILFSVAVTMLFTVIISNPTTRQLVYFLTIGRNFENIDENVLDDRGSTYAKKAYWAFTKTDDIWVGKGVEKFRDIGILSDYRGFIFKFGIIGLSISLLLIVQLLFGMDKRMAFLLFPMVLLVFAHRSWMFNYVYIYFFLLLGYLFSVNKKLTLE